MSRHSFSAYDSAMLSDEGDLYSDEEDGTVYGGDLRNSNGDKIIPTAADRRAHHNALERKRRDHIKDSFTSLRDSVPSLQGEKVTQASRAQILKKAAEYIQFMRKKNNNVQSDIDEIAKQNKMLEDQIRRMEKAKNGGGGSVGSGGLSSLHLAGSSGGSSSSAAASSVGNGVGGGGGGGSPLLYTEQIEVSTSYDTSEQDSNGSCSNSNGPMQIIQQQQQPMQPMQHGKPAKIGAGGSGSFSGAGISIISAASILEGGSGSSSSSSPSSSSSNSSPFSTLSPSPVTATYSAGPSSSSLKSGGTVLINGGGGSTNGTTLRPVMQLAKNGSLGGIGGSGTSKIIVQNPQHKNGGQPHVIHVTTSPAASAMLANGVGLGGLGGLGVGGGNITAMSSSGKPIIITSAQLSAAAANGTLTVINGQNGKCK